MQCVYFQFLRTKFLKRLESEPFAVLYTIMWWKRTRQLLVAQVDRGRSSGIVRTCLHLFYRRTLAFGIRYILGATMWPSKQVPSKSDYESCSVTLHVTIENADTFARFARLHFAKSSTERARMTNRRNCHYKIRSLIFSARPDSLAKDSRDA